MNPSTRFLRSVSLAFITMAMSCSDDDTEQPSPYKWEESAISPDNLFSHAQFEVGDDGFLYTWGTLPSTGQRAIFRYTGNYLNTWETIAEVNLDVYSNVESLTIIQGSVYLHVFNKLYKVENGLTSEILSADLITGIATLQNNIVICGEGINVSNDKFTIVSYDGTTFQPMSKELALGRIISANDKLYVQGFPGFSYDGQDLDSLDFYGYFYAVDEDESIYFGESLFSDFTMERKLANGQVETVGDVIRGFGAPHEVDLYNGTLFIASAPEFADDISTVYFLRDDKKWIKIPTEHYIYDVVIFDNKLFSISWDGKIYELVNNSE